MEIIKDNVYANNQSFLYYLHEECCINYMEFEKLCDAVLEAKKVRHIQKDLDYMVNFIYGCILKNFMYHFDKNDLYTISNLGSDYNEEIIDKLDMVIKEYFLN